MVLCYFQNADVDATHVAPIANVDQVANAVTAVANAAKNVFLNEPMTLFFLHYQK